MGLWEAIVLEDHVLGTGTPLLSRASHSSRRLAAVTPPVPSAPLQLQHWREGTAGGVRAWPKSWLKALHRAS